MLARQALTMFRAAEAGGGTGGSSGPGSGEGSAPGSFSSSAEPGLVLGGRYQLLSPIASGGMAQVWRAQDTSLVRQVAVKILHPHLATDEAFVSRFRREALASARLSHPSIVAIYDTLSQDGVEAIVMELIEGRTLRDRLNEAGALPPPDVVDVGVQIADALGEAHRAGIVHRDIKPANIMVGDDRRIMVTDFGIAKANKDADLTHTGTLLGTAKYLAPEQVAGEPVDARADIYALGIVLFESATGQPPFLAETDAGTALARLQGEVPRCRQRKPSVPIGLDDVIARAMAREPAERFSHAVELKSALELVDLNQVRTPMPAGGVPPGMPPTPSQEAPTFLSTLPPPESGTAVLPTAPVQQPGKTPGGKKPTKRQQAKANKKQTKLATRQAKKQAKKQGRQRPTKTILAALIIGGFVLAGVLVTSTGSGRVSADPRIESALPFDPYSDSKTEQNDLAPFAIDGDDTTEWQTEGYFRPGLGGLKDGVGLILTLEQRSSVEELRLVTRSEGWAAEIYVADEIGPNDESFEVSALGDPLAAVTDGGAEAVLSLDGAVGSQVLIWITETGPLGDRYRFALIEATVR